MNLAAILAVGLAGVVAVFQIALALGAPSVTQLGVAVISGVLPGRLRIASGVAGVVVYPVIGLFVLASAGLIKADWMPGTGKTGMWILAGLFTLGTLANFASRSKKERFWGPSHWSSRSAAASSPRIFRCLCLMRRCPSGIGARRTGYGSRYRQLRLSM